MELVDTHCHIQSANNPLADRQSSDMWAKDPSLTGNQMIANAAEAGVTKLLCVGCDLNDSRLAIDFVEDKDNCWATIGIHPHESKDYVDKPELLEEFKSLAVKPKVVAVGECGFDFYYNHSPKEAQIPILKAQIELALKHNLPMIFHVREALNDFWPIFDSYQGIRGVLHSFTDSRENLDEALKRNLYIGVNGIATFAKDPAQLDMYRAIPLQKLLLETDAPFLTPTPYRGSINEPKRVRNITEFVANLRGEDVESLAAATTQNAHDLFGI